MKHSQARIAVLLTAAAGLATAAASARADGYQYIISGDPVAASTAGSSAAVSPATSLETGTLTAKTTEGALEARYRTWDESDGEALRSDKPLATILYVR